MSKSDNPGARVYVGDLGSGGSKPELEKEFERFGPLKSVWVARNPPGFAFVEFEDARDAQDAVRDMDGRHVGGIRIRVEIAKNSSRASGRGGGGGGRNDDRGYGRSGGRRGYSPRRSPRGYRSRSPDDRRGYGGGSHSPSPPRYRSPDRGRRRGYSPR